MTRISSTCCRQLLMYLIAIFCMFGLLLSLYILKRRNDPAFINVLKNGVDKPEANNDVFTSRAQNRPFVVVDTHKSSPLNNKTTKILIIAQRLNKTNKSINMNEDGRVKSFEKVKVLSENQEDSLKILEYQRIHVFYYVWYENPEYAGKYLHWNHRYMPHWDKKEDRKWPHGEHVPPDDIGANYYPALGPYSSQDRNVVDTHMMEMKQAGIGVVVVSWYPPDQSDDQGLAFTKWMMLMDSAHKFELKVTLHIELYTGRNEVNFKENIKYILDTFGEHPAFYKCEHKGKTLPLFYVYDSYLLASNKWANILHPQGSDSVRHTNLDAIYIGLLVEEKHMLELRSAGFDGFYTYFASKGFTYGSSQFRWPLLSKFAKENDLLFIPSVGPGYSDTRVRAWNGANTKNRQDGKYYEESFQAAMAINPNIISITSFNEWHEGTQIEPADTKEIPGFKYLDYSPNSPNFYLDLTKKMVSLFLNKIKAY